MILHNTPDLLFMQIISASCYCRGLGSYAELFEYDAGEDRLYRPERVEAGSRESESLTKLFPGKHSGW